MKNYESPVIYDNEELAEGVYATGSGGGEATDCWVYTMENGQQELDNPTEKFHVYKVIGDHLCVEHISLWTVTNYTITPGTPGEVVQKVECAGVTVTPNGVGESSERVYEEPGHVDIGPRFVLTLDSSGTSFSLKRTCHGNAYAGGAVTDHFDVNVKIFSTNGTCTLAMVDKYCEHTINVQGRYD